MEKSPYSVSIHGTVHGWSICIVAVYMYGVTLLTNENVHCQDYLHASISSH